MTIDLNRMREFKGHEEPLLKDKNKPTKMGDVLVDMLKEVEKKNSKPSCLVINKIDDKTHENNLYQFYELGLGDPVHISAIGGRNMGDFLDIICSKIPDISKKDKQYEDYLNLAIVGMPNVGKSSLMNSLLNEEKSLAVFSKMLDGFVYHIIDAVFV